MAKSSHLLFLLPNQVWLRSAPNGFSLIPPEAAIRGRRTVEFAGAQCNNSFERGFRELRDLPQPERETLLSSHSWAHLPAVLR
jgi:hypothetical protein